MTPLETINEYLADKEKLEQAATKGLWLPCTEPNLYIEGEFSAVGPTVSKTQAHCDARFIRHARNNSRREIKAMRLLVEALEEMADYDDPDALKAMYAPIVEVARKALADAAEILRGEK